MKPQRLFDLTSQAFRGVTRCCLLAVALGVWISSAAAQDLLLHPGARIRFGVGNTDPLHVAELGHATPDSLVLRKCQTCNRLGYSRVEVNRLAVFRRTPYAMRVVSGFGYGGLAGLGLGVLAASSCHGGDQCDGGIILIPALGLLGGLFGALAGYLTAYSWDPVPGGR